VTLQIAHPLVQAADVTVEKDCASAVNAALMLAYVAKRGGDKVGLTLFSDSVKTFIPAGSGSKQLAKIVPVVKVDKRRIGDGRPGPVTLRLAGAFHKLTKVSGMRYI